MGKYLHVSDLLERRIRHGDYLLKTFPTDRQLSNEFEVDTRTARKAVAKLIDAGLLVRRSNGRPTVIGSEDAPAKGKTLRVAMLSVAYPTPSAWQWQRVIRKAAAEREALFRPVNFVHVDDASVQDTLEGFDAVFFGIFGHDLTPHLVRTIRRCKTPVVFLGTDASGEGFPSIQLTAPEQVERLLRHLRDGGHERVACLNTQAHNAVTRRRLAIWRAWVGADHHRLLVDEPVAPFESASEQAYRSASKTFAAGGFDATALFCCTAAAAKGVYRAAHEHGVVIGRDLAICAADDGVGEASLLVPSLTALQDPDPTPYLERCFAWFARGGKGWQGPLLNQAGSSPLFVGESTGGHGELV